MAFIAIDPSTGENARRGAPACRTPHYEAAEYAILVRSDLKGRGLGWLLMQMMIEYARSEGLQRLTGQVLRSNRKMLEMCRALGFSVSVDPEDRDVYDVALPLVSTPSS